MKSDLHLFRKSSFLLPEVLIQAYRHGYFPMAEPYTEEIYWHSPDPRAVIPLDGAKISRSLRQIIRKNLFEVRINTAFPDVISACAQRADTWISEEIISAYIELHELGYAHSVEAWQDDILVGGLYGVAIGGAFFGESMFSNVSNASKVAFAALIEHLRKRNFLLLDTQYLNPHTQLLGAIEISHTEYILLLQMALEQPTSFDANINEA